MTIQTTAAEYVAPGSLVPNERNPRDNDRAVRDVKRSIKAYGFGAPIVARSEGRVVIAGHTRLKASLELGLKEVPVRFLDLSEDQANALMLADNKTNELALWTDGLGDLLEHLLQEDLDVPGFDPEELERLIHGDPVSGAATEARATLLERFGVPPFTVLDSRRGYWVERRKAWISLGIESEVGRDTLEEGGKGLLYKNSPSGQDPSFYEQKRTLERLMGRGISTEDFIATYYRNKQEGGGISETGTSVFDPVLCELAVRWFSPPRGAVLDPFAGGSVRGIVSGKCGRSYIGVELREEQVRANRIQASRIFSAGDEEEDGTYSGITKDKNVRTQEATLPPWTQGIPIEDLKSVTDVFRENDEGRIFGAFTKMSEVSLAKSWKEGALYLVRDDSGSPVVAAVARKTKTRKKIRDFTGAEVCVLPKGTVHVSRFAVREGFEGALLGLLSRLRDEGGLAVECWHERPLDRALVLLMGLQEVSLKIRASSEMVSVWSDSVEPHSLDPVDVPTLSLLLGDIPVEDLRRALEEQVSEGIEWKDHYSSYNKRNTWTALVLRGYGGRVDFVEKPEEMSKSWKKENPESLSWEIEDTPLRGSLPEVEEILERIPTTGFHRIRLMRLEAGGELTRHADITDKDAGTRDGSLLRLHVPIQTNDGALFTTVDAHGREVRHHLGIGEMWSLDTRKPHAARNDGETDRIHLVVDCESTQDLRDLFEGGLDSETIPVGSGFEVLKSYPDGVGWEEFSDLQPLDVGIPSPEPLPSSTSDVPVKVGQPEDPRKESTQRHETTPTWMTGDSSTLLPTFHRSEADSFDLVFSCPPYFDLEKYSDLEEDISNAGSYDSFLEVYRTIIRESCRLLRDDRFAVWVVGDVRDPDGNYRGLVSDTIRAFQDSGLSLYNQAILVTPLGSLPVRAPRFFEAGRKLGKTHQDVLVFIKGDAKKATKACGSVEFGTLEEVSD